MAKHNVGWLMENMVVIGATRLVVDHPHFNAHASMRCHAWKMHATVINSLLKLEMAVILCFFAQSN